MSKGTAGFRPTNIEADRNTAKVIITWNDGKTCAYPFDLIRNACPCAQCRGGHEHMKPEPPEDVFVIPLMPAGSTKLRNLTSVGNYAINIEWEDGHRAGIYNWHYLRSLCENSGA